MVFLIWEFFDGDCCAVEARPLIISSQIKDYTGFTNSEVFTHMEDHQQQRCTVPTEPVSTAPRYRTVYPHQWWWGESSPYFT